jgi:uncharacterized membrane protein YgdD (TMEM256/DUF423 family)
MKPTAKWLLIWGAIAACCGVALGAFGAHSLRGSVFPDMLGIFETGVRYQMYHAFGMIVAGLACRVMPENMSKRFALAGFLFGAGVLLFSGSLYALVLTDATWLGAITPLGGLSFIAGWAVLASAFWKIK